MKDKKEVKDIEVKNSQIVKPKKRVKQVAKWTFKEDLGTDENGEIRFKKGQSYELTKEQIKNYNKHNLICQI